MHAGQSQVPSISESDREKGGEVTDEVDLRGFRPAGGPIIIELLEMPPQAKAVNNWTIRKGVFYTLLQLHFNFMLYLINPSRD